MADALALLAPSAPPRRGSRGGVGVPLSSATAPHRSVPRPSGSRAGTTAAVLALEDLPGLRLLDELCSLHSQPCVRYIASVTRLVRAKSPRHTPTYFHDTAIADKAKHWARDDNRRRRDVAEEMAQCTFHPVVSETARTLPRAKVKDFNRRGRDWLEHKERKLTRKRAKEEQEAAEEYAEEHKMWALSTESRTWLERRKQRLDPRPSSSASSESSSSSSGDEDSDSASSDATTRPRHHHRGGADEQTPPPRRGPAATYRYSAYTDPRTWRPETTSHPMHRKMAQTPVVERVTHHTPRPSRTHEEYLAEQRALAEQPRRCLAMDEPALDKLVDRLHAPRKLPNHLRPACNRASVGCTGGQRSGMAECSFKPAIRKAPKSVLPQSDSQLVRPKRWDPAQDELAETIRYAPPALVSFTKDQSDSFFGRTDEWKRQVQQRRVELQRQKDEREFYAHPYSPRITRMARVSGRCWGLDGSDDDGGRAVATPPHNASRALSPGISSSAPSPQPKVLPYQPDAMRMLEERVPATGPTVNDAADDLVRSGVLKEIFDELDPTVGFVAADAALVALEHLAATLGVPPRRSIVDASELPSRIGYADFAALFQRIVPLAANGANPQPPPRQSSSAASSLRR